MILDFKNKVGDRLLETIGEFMCLILGGCSDRERELMCIEPDSGILTAQLAQLCPYFVCNGFCT